jgi:hypothetical protein
MLSEISLHLHASHATALQLAKARAVKHNKGMARAQKVVEISTKLPVPEKNPAAVALGRLGGLKGGNGRAASMTPERRKEIAQQAAKQRWANRESKVVESTAVRAMDSKKAGKLA